MSGNPAVRKLRLPPANFESFKVPRTRQPARDWFRVHLSGCAAARFSLTTHHRFSHQDCPYPILYFGVDAETCLFERFGDTLYDGRHTLPKALWDADSLSLVRVPQIAICDLTSTKTLSALRADLSTLMHHDLSIPQSWGLMIQKHPARFEGIKFRSRFNGKACLALFQRDAIEKRLQETSLAGLTNNDAAVDWLDQHQVSLY